MTQLQHDLTILQNAADLGFNQEDCINNDMDPFIFEFAAENILPKEIYSYIFEKVVQYAESYICTHQVPEFIKEVHIDLVLKRAFEFEKSDGSWVNIDSFGEDLIDWDEHKDCKDDDKIFFCHYLDSDLKTVLKFYDLGSKRHLV